MRCAHAYIPCIALKIKYNACISSHKTNYLIFTPGYLQISNRVRWAICAQLWYVHHVARHSHTVRVLLFSFVLQLVWSIRLKVTLSAMGHMYNHYRRVSEATLNTSHESLEASGMITTKQILCLFNGILCNWPCPNSLLPGTPFANMVWL